MLAQNCPIPLNCYEDRFITPGAKRFLSHIWPQTAIFRLPGTVGTKFHAFSFSFSSSLQTSVATVSISVHQDVADDIRAYSNASPIPKILFCGSSYEWTPSPASAQLISAAPLPPYSRGASEPRRTRAQMGQTTELPHRYTIATLLRRTRSCGCYQTVHAFPNSHPITAGTSLTAVVTEDLSGAVLSESEGPFVAALAGSTVSYANGNWMGSRRV